MLKFDIWIWQWSSVISVFRAASKISTKMCDKSYLGQFFPRVPFFSDMTWIFQNQLLCTNLCVNIDSLPVVQKEAEHLLCFWFAASQLMILCLSSSWHIPSLRYFFCRWLLICTCTYVCSAKPKHLKHCDNTSPSQVMSLPPGYKVKSWNSSAHPGTSFISLFLLSPWRWWAFSLGKPQRQPGLWSLMFSPCLPS